MKSYKQVRSIFFAIMGAGVLKDKTWNKAMDIYHAYREEYGTMKNWSSLHMFYFRVNVNEVLKGSGYEV